jgi:hypothetical protein
MTSVEAITPATTDHENRRPSWMTAGLVAETIATWQPYYAEQLTERDAVAILQSVGGLVDILERSP